MLRFRWFDREPDDLSAPIDWRFSALIIATLFLNFPFWIVSASDLRMSCSLPLYAVHVGIVTLLIAALFFVGPALAAQAAKRPLFGIIENSLGSVPTFGIRFCCVLFLLAWTAKLIAWAELLPLLIVQPQGWSSIESGAIGIGTMVFLAFTSFQNVQTTAKLARFINKLGAAILIAALIRVRHGWPAVLTQSPVSSVYSEGLDLWQGLSQLAFNLAPLVFFAANFGYRSPGRKAVAMTALMGIAVPLAGTLLLVGTIGIATTRSGFYVPSLEPNVAMALWSHAASSALLGRMMLAAITAFGAIRFGIRALVDSASIRPLGSRWTLVLLGFLAGAIVLVSADPYAPTFQLLTNLLAVVPAVLTADFVTRSWRVDRAQRFDWIGVTALIAGLATPFYIPNWIVGADDNPWWHPWLLPSYGVAFLVCLLGRTARQISRKYT